MSRHEELDLNKTFFVCIITVIFTVIKISLQNKLNGAHFESLPQALQVLLAGLVTICISVCVHVYTQLLHTHVHNYMYVYM